LKTLSWPRSNGFIQRNRKDAKEAGTKHRILIADGDTPFARQLSHYLSTHGFEAKCATSVSQTKELIEFWQPDTVFIDLLLPETNALSVFKFLNSKQLKTVPKVIVMSKQALPQGVEQMRKAGASHYLVKPFSLEEAFRAVAVTNVDEEAGSGGLELGPGTIKELHLLNLFLKQATMSTQTDQSLYNLMRMINLKVKAMRCSLIQCMQNDTGRVLASNDDERVQNLALDLKKYPEILELRRTLAPVIIPNVNASELMAKVHSQISRTPFETILLFPVFRCGTFFGALSVRMQQRDPIELFYVEKFGQVCSQIISLAIGTPGQRLITD
jgi:DNA-binding response OmpR family regulator